jgi:DNA-binding NarL/FixJ family response regulator
MVVRVPASETRRRRRELLIEQYRILLVDVSRLTRELVERAVAHAEDMGVVGTATADAELDELAASTHADVLIVGLHDSGLPPSCVDVLMEHPRMKVLAIEERAGRARLYELRPEQVEIGEVSPDDVLETIRSALLRPTPF